jgi:hypothetical protein
MIGISPGVNQRTCDFPVGCVPANEQNFFCKRLCQTNPLSGGGLSSLWNQFSHNF